MANPSRRAVTAALVALPATLATGAAPAVNALAIDPSPDAELFRLETEFKEAYRHWLDEEEADTAAVEQLEAELPYPALPPNGASNEAWATYFKVRDAYWEESERRGISRDDWRGTMRSVDAIAQRILAVPAVSLAGLMVKVRLGKWFEDGDEYGMAEMHKSVLADLEAMGGGNG